MKIRNQQAFTLIEIVLVVGMLMVIFGYIGPKVIKLFGQKADAEVKFKLMAIKDGLNEFRQEFGAFPTDREGLRALVENPQPNNDRFKAKESMWPILKEDAIMDSAGNEFAYHCPPQQYKKEYKHFELLYLGPTQSEDDPLCQHDGI